MFSTATLELRHEQSIQTTPVPGFGAGYFSGGLRRATPKPPGLSGRLPAQSFRGGQLFPVTGDGNPARCQEHGTAVCAGAGSRGDAKKLATARGEGLHATNTFFVWN